MDENIAVCFKIHFDGITSELWKRPILAYFENLKLCNAKMSDLLDLIVFRSVGVFIVVLILRVGLALTSASESEWDPILLLCCTFLAAVGLFGFNHLLRKQIDRLLGFQVKSQVVFKILGALEDESIVLESCLQGKLYEAAVRIHQKNILEVGQGEFKKSFQKITDLAPGVVFLIFLLLSVCFLFFPILGMMQEVR